MVCRHSPGDTTCSKYANYPKYPNTSSKTPDPKNYSVLEVEEIGKALVMKVQYPNCERCSYEGTKVMVFLNTSLADAVKWKEIDPHFRDPSLKHKTSAPSPSARFPASPEGWCDAISYARGKE